MHPDRRDANREKMTDDSEKPDPVEDDRHSNPEEDELPEFDDDAIVNAIKFPTVKASLTRWVIAVVVIALIVYAARTFFGPGGFAVREQATTDEGQVYSTGDVVSSPTDANELLRVNIDEERYVDLSPGASIRLDSPERNEDSRITLLNGRILYTGPFTGRRATITTILGDIGTPGGRLFAELWGRTGEQRLRVGMLHGNADFVTTDGDILPLVVGKGAFAGDDLEPGYVVPPLYEFPNLDPRLDRWVYTSLTQSEDPTITDVIESVGHQAGLRVTFPEWLSLANFSIKESVSRWGLHRAGEVLEGLGMQWGFGFGIRDDELLIIPLDEGEHTATIGEWALVNWVHPDALFWPDRFRIAGNETVAKRLQTVAALSASPLERRVGALAMLIGYNRMDPATRDDDFIDFEINLAFDLNQPYFLRRLAFEDLYNNPLVTPEEIVPKLEIAGIDVARDYMRMRVWMPPAWGDQGVWGVYEDSLTAKLDADASKAGLLYSGFVHNSLEYKDASQYASAALTSTDPGVAIEAAHFLRDIAVYTPASANPDIIGNTMKSIFDAKRSDVMILGLDGLRHLSSRLTADSTLLWLIDPYVTEKNAHIASYAAAALGSLLQYHPFDDVERWNGFIDERDIEIADPDSEQSISTLRLLGMVVDLDIEPCLTDESFIVALQTRLSAVTGPQDRLLALRYLRSQVTALHSTEGLGWIQGDTVDYINQILSETDPNFLLEAILTLDLHKGGYPANGGEDVEALRSVLDKFFISLAEHSDPRLRLVALEYIRDNRPDGYGEVIARLADDEYPLIASTASGIE